MCAARARGGAAPRPAGRRRAPGGPTLCAGVVLPRPLRVRGLLPRSKVRKVIKASSPVRASTILSSIVCAAEPGASPPRPAPAGRSGGRGAARRRGRPAPSAPSPRAGATQPPPRHGTLSNVAKFTPTHSAHPQTGQSWTHARHSHAVSINLNHHHHSCTPPCSEPHPQEGSATASMRAKCARRTHRKDTQAHVRSATQPLKA